MTINQSQNSFSAKFINAGLVALGVIIASHTSSGIHYDQPSTLFFVVIILTILNILIKPILVLFALPFVILTLGLGLWFINACLFMLVAEIVSGFTVVSFTSALWGAMIVSLTPLIAKLFMMKSKIQVNTYSTESRNAPIRDRKPIQYKDDDVIDI